MDEVRKAVAHVRARMGRLRARPRRIQAAGWVFFGLFLAGFLFYVTSDLESNGMHYDPVEPLWQLSAQQRQEIFDRIIREHPRREREAQRSFSDPWSRRDHYQHLMQGDVHRIAANMGLHYSYVYLVYDLAVHEQWVGFNGHMLPASPVPHQLRTQ